MNMFARFDENPAMTLEDIKETKRYGRTHGRTHNVKTVYPPQTKFAGYCIGNISNCSIKSCGRSQSAHEGTIYAYTKALLGEIV